MAYPYPHVLNPSIPYTGPIHGGLSINKMVFVQGSTRGSGRFDINLQCGNHNDRDIALHFNPRFEGTNQIVRNSRVQGHWGNEERNENWPFPEGQQSFEVIFLVLDHCYKIAINGVHYTEYNHRIEKETVNAINVGGDVSISCITFEGGTPTSDFPDPPAYAPPQLWYAPSPGAGYSPPPSNPYAQAAPIYDPPVPYTGAIPNGLSPGKMIFISGSPNIGAARLL